MRDTEFVFVYSTFPNKPSAKKVAQTLVTKKLAACVNIHPAMTSVYEWKGKVQTTREVAAFIKTRAVLVDKVIAAARPMHPYTVPCFLVLPIEHGNADYMEWARTQTKK